MPPGTFSFRLPGGGDMVGKFLADMNLVYRLLATVDSFAPTILRLVLAVVFTVHGGQKTIGWMGGDGWSATLNTWSNPEGLNIPYPLAALGVLVEVFGALGLLTGCLTRLAALGIFGSMTVATFAVHWPGGFLASNKGYEYPFALAGMALALIVGGGGRWSVDRLLSNAMLPPASREFAGRYRLPL